METLVVVAHHRNHYQYHGRSRCHGQARPSRSFRDVNCRSFQSGIGLLPSPVKSSTTTHPVTKRSLSPPFSPKTPSSSVDEDPKNSNKTAENSLIPVSVKIECEEEGYFDDYFQSSELWAGPAYSNSPPPSSLPMPKFSLRPKRTVSLDLPTTASEFDLHLISKSAPASPRSPTPSDLFDSADSREWSPFPTDLLGSSNFATKTLRRILNLDITDE